MNKLLQFIKRDFQMEIAYKTKFVSDLFYVVFPVVLYYFLAKMIGDKSSTQMAKYSCDYFSFVMVGIATANILQAALQSYTENVRKFMVEGSLEAMFATPTPHYMLIVYSSAWPFIYAILKTLLQFIAAFLLFGFTLRNLNVASTLISVALSLVLFNAIGVISASLLIVIKKGDPVNWLVIQLSYVFGGILFPIDLLPGWAQALSYLFPVRHALESTRYAMLAGYDPVQLLPHLVPLAVFTAALLPVSVFFCTYLVNMARRSGALSLF
ncbi:MAG: ABC transporter permease [Blastocatellia bacterium]